MRTDLEMCLSKPLKTNNLNLKITIFNENLHSVYKKKNWKYDKQNGILVYTKNQSEQTKIQYDIILINWGPSFRAGSEMLNVEGGKRNYKNIFEKVRNAYAISIWCD